MEKNNEHPDPAARLAPPAQEKEGADARKLHIALNVWLRRQGCHAPACDGPDCGFCDLLASGLHGRSAPQDELRSIHRELLRLANIGAGARSVEAAANDLIDGCTHLERRVYALLQPAALPAPPAENPWQTAALLHDRTRRAIRDRHAAGDSVADLATDYGVPAAYIDALVAWQMGADKPLSPWQDIASAPKDGRRVLLAWPYWSNRPVVGWWQVNGGWQSDNAVADGGDPPTHWAPLPPLPTPPLARPPARETTND